MKRNLTLVVFAGSLALSFACCSNTEPSEQPQRDWGKTGGGEGEGTGEGEGAEDPCAGADQICMGASKADITMDLVGFELPKNEYLRETEECYHPAGSAYTNCGELADDFLWDCGEDRLCPGDEGYTAPDTGEMDGVPDYFWDCGRDQICPGDSGYPGADADGTEGDGKFQAGWIAGFGFNRPATGVWDHAWARAVAFKHSGQTMVIVVLDLMGYFYDDVERLRRKVAEKYPDLKIDYLMPQATHDHQSPDALGNFGIADPESGFPIEAGVDEAYLAFVLEKTAQAVGEAVQNLEPAELYSGSAFTGVKGLVMDYRDPVIINDEMIVLRGVKAGTTETIATIVHWANHPESLEDRNNDLSSDYPGWLRDAVENGLDDDGTGQPVPGVGGVAIYANGAGGGMMAVATPAYKLDGTAVEGRNPEATKTVGQTLAFKALGIIRDSSEKIVDFGDGIKFAKKIYYLPVVNKYFQVAFLANDLLKHRQLYFANGTPYDKSTAGSLADDPPHVRTEQAVVRIGGSITLFTIPGEMFPEWSIGGFNGEYTCGRDPANSGQCDYVFVNAEAENPPDVSQAPKGPYLLEIMPGKYKLLMGVTLDEIGYLVPDYDFKLGEPAYIEEAPGDHYEETNGLGPFGQTIDQNARDLAEEVK